MKHLAFALLLSAVSIAPACGSAPPHVALTDQWPAQPGDYGDTVEAWTRKASLHGDLQEVLQLSAILKSPAWRAAHAARDADHRGLAGDARQQRIAQAQAEAAGPYEVEMLVSTWDRRENDLDRGKRSVWHVTLLDETGHEIAPLEIVKDKRPASVLRAEFPSLGDFATAYIARFPRTTTVFGPAVKKVELRISSERGGVSVVWD